MGSNKPKRDKWYTIKPRILEMSARQIGAMNLFTVFMIVTFLLLSQGLPPDKRYEFIRSTIPIFLGLFLASGGAWLYKRFNPDNPDFEGYTLKRWLFESVYGVIILAAVFGTWVLLLRAGYEHLTIACVFAVVGLVILLLVLVLYLTFRLRDRKSESAVSSDSGDE